MEKDFLRRTGSTQAEAMISFSAVHYDNMVRRTLCNFVYFFTAECISIEPSEVTASRS